MLIILSQKIDSKSDYSDKLFLTYHYPSRYKNQIHEGDTFVYYQGNRYVKDQRYYFGTGTVGKINTPDGTNYYAELSNVKKFIKPVPIYLDNGTYVEQLGFESVRKSPNPPWQSSIRPLSKQAYDYIISASGIYESNDGERFILLKEELKSIIRSFYLNSDNNALLKMNSIITEMISISELNEIN